MIARALKERVRLRFETTLAAAGVVGVATIVLPFTYDVSPFDAIVEVGGEIFAGNLAYLDGLLLLLFLASPFCLAIPITAACVKELWTGSLSRPAWLTVYALALAMAGATLGSLTLVLLDEGSLALEVYFILFPPLIVLALGVGWIIRNWRRGLAHTLNAVIAMQMAYIANGVLCLALFFEDDGWQAGAYMTIVTVVLYLAHMAFASLPEHHDGTHDDPPRGDKSWQLS